MYTNSESLFTCHTALHIASGAQHSECVQILLDNRAVLARDKSGTCPSQLAHKPDVCLIFKKYLDLKAS